MEKTHARYNAYRFINIYGGCDGLTAELSKDYFQPAMKEHRIDAASIDIIPHGTNDKIDSITATTYFVVDGNFEPLFLTFTVNGTVKYTVSKEAVKILDSRLSKFADFVESFIRDLFGVAESTMDGLYIDAPFINVHDALYDGTKHESDR